MQLAVHGCVAVALRSATLDTLGVSSSPSRAQLPAALQCSHDKGILWVFFLQLRCGQVPQARHPRLEEVPDSWVQDGLGGRHGQDVLLCHVRDVPDAAVTGVHEACAGTGGGWSLKQAVRRCTASRTRTVVERLRRAFGQLGDPVQVHL